MPGALAEACGKRHSATCTMPVSATVCLLLLPTPLLLPFLQFEESSRNAGRAAGGIHTNASFSQGCSVTAGQSDDDDEEDDDGAEVCVPSLAGSVVLRRWATKNTTR